jgi:single-stranded DNA-binding protein
MANNKYYSFISIADGADGSKNITTIVTLTRPEMKELEGDKKVFRCAAPISNRAKTLSNALGCELPQNEETTWVDVAFWNERAERAQKFFGDRTSVRVVLCGKLTVRKWKGEDGNERVRVQISANDWAALPSNSAKKEEEEETLY